MRQPSGPPTRPSALLDLVCEGYRRRETVALRMSVGVLYLWFGAMKLPPGLSPAQDIATDTMSVMTFHLVNAELSRPLLAVMEVAIGIGLICGRQLPAVLALFAIHMAGVFATLAIMSDRVWQHPFVPSMEGQYILKNVVLVTACLSIAATTPHDRRGKTVPARHETMSP